MSEPAVSDLLTVAQAISIIDATPVAPRLVEVPLQEAQGLRLAEDLRADRNYPPFDKSLMDGFAVRCADLPKGELKVDRKSTRLNSSHVEISYAVFCLKKKKKKQER